MENKEATFFQDYSNLIESFEAIAKTEDNPFFKSKFVPLKVILPLVKKHCKENNFVFMQYPQFAEGKNLLFTKIMHKTGENISGSIELVAKDATDPQKLGGAMTYMRRYSLTCMFGLEEEDDDANKASGNITKPKGSYIAGRFQPNKAPTEEQKNIAEMLDAIK